MRKRILEIMLITFVIIINIVLFIVLMDSVRDYINKIENGYIIQNQGMESNKKNLIELLENPSYLTNLVTNLNVLRVILLISLLLGGVYMCVKITRKFKNNRKTRINQN